MYKFIKNTKIHCLLFVEDRTVIVLTGEDTLNPSYEMSVTTYKEVLNL